MARSKKYYSQKFRENISFITEYVSESVFMTGQF